MPKLPTYESKTSLPAIDLPRVPQGAGSEVGAAMVRAGGQIASTGLQWVDAMNKAEAEAQVSAAMAEASVQLQDLRNRTLNSGEFNTDPEGARSIWEAEAAKIGQGLSGTVTNRLAKQRFQESWSKMMTSHSLSMSDETRRKRVDIVKGSGLRSINAFADAAASAPDEAIFQENIKNAVTTVRGLMASGAIGYDDGVRLERAAIDQAHKTRILNVALQNPMAAQGMLEKAQLGGQISPDTALRLADHMKPLVDAQTSRGIVDQVLSGAPSPKGLSAEQKNVGQQVMDFFTSRGYEPHQAAGAVSNFFRESGLNPNIKTGDGGKSWYLGQWNGARRTALLDYAKTKGESEPSVQTQLEFMEKELDSPEYAKAKAGLKSAKTEMEAHDALMVHYEKPRDQRLGRAALVGEHFGAKKEVPTASGPVTAQDIEKNYSALEADVRARAQAARPGDAVFEDHAVSHFRQQAGVAMQARKMEDNANMDTLLQSVISGDITSESQLLADPMRANAYAALFASAPEKILQLRGVIDHNANADERKNAYTPEKAVAYKNYMDLYATDQKAFLEKTENLVADLPALGKENFQRLVALRTESLSGKKNHEAETLQHAVNGELDAFFPAKLAPKGGDALEKWNITKANTFAAVDAAIREEKAANNGKPVSPERAREIVRGFAISGAIAGTGFMGFGKEEGRAIDLQKKEGFVPEQTQVPDRFKGLMEAINKQDTKNKAVVKFDSKVRQWYVLYKGERLYGPETGLNQPKPQQKTSMLRKPIPLPEEETE